jgi:hypothetical protein
VGATVTAKVKQDMSARYASSEVLQTTYLAPLSARADKTVEPLLVPAEGSSGSTLSYARFRYGLKRKIPYGPVPKWIREVAT